MVRFMAVHYSMLSWRKIRINLWRGIDQSEIDPGVVAGGEGGMGSAAPLRA
jgi:hypothetical protein